MKWINYSRYTGEDFGISAEDLMKALADFFLQSGYEYQYMQFSEFDQNALERLKEAIEQALRERRVVRPAKGRANGGTGRKHVCRRIRAAREPHGPKAVRRRLYQYRKQPGQQGGTEEPKDVKFQVTDKSVDFLGFKTLKDLMAGLGRSSFGAHDTREMSTGVETSGSAKLYEFGDTMNLDVSETLFSALKREGLRFAPEPRVSATCTYINPSIRARARRFCCSIAATV